MLSAEIAEVAATQAVANAQQLRDEQVRFDNFCLAKGADDCPSDASLPDFSLTPDVVTTTIAPGGANSYTPDIAPLRARRELSLTGSNAVPGSPAIPAATNLTGLPAGSTASFTPNVVTGGFGSSTLTIVTSAATPPGSYTLVVNGISSDGVCNRVATVSLVVTGTPGDVNHDGVVSCSDIAVGLSATLESRLSVAAAIS